ncbi:nitrite reductase [Alkalihalobacillus pseudalcaliphilus]|uniref:nitrite reductase n=1 Tax=Alkalihalobacillus pseudalcaliphilus TaxID=79884 RepID=UPI00064D7904|nr:nitrite reductase [Alkalihalobacillus pseudalcaliphilus]KMK76320.1 nitrite reductase [Alkalihalobacillus pseudalcaliphilus]
MTVKKIKLAVNGGIAFGAKLNARQLILIASYMNNEEEVELTTFQQIYIEVEEERVEEIKEKFNEVGLFCYPVGNFVKSLRTCNFCKGEEEEGMPVAKEINKRIAGKPVPFTLKPAYTGCPVGCGEPLVNDIGIMKRSDAYDLYIGGHSKGKNARVGNLVLEQLTPEQLYEAVDKIITIYSENGKKREALFKFVDRFGLENIKSHLVN